MFHSGSDSDWRENEEEGRKNSLSSTNEELILEADQVPSILSPSHKHIKVYINIPEVFTVDAAVSSTVN